MGFELGQCNLKQFNRVQKSGKHDLQAVTASSLQMHVTHVLNTTWIRLRIWPIHTKLAADRTEGKHKPQHATIYQHTCYVIAVYSLF